MSAHESFALELNGTAVRGTLHLPPAPATRGEAAPPKPGVVILCLGPGKDTGALADDLLKALLKASLAVATFDSEPHEEHLGEAADRASAALHALAARDDVDLRRFGVLGHSLGAITAASLAGRSDMIRRLVLLAPVSRELLAERLATADAASVAADLGAAQVGATYFNGLDKLDSVRDSTRFDRPTLILQGAADRALPVESSNTYRDAILDAGHQVEHLLVGLGDHDFSDAAIRRACAARVARFFSEPAGVEVGNAGS
jgi:dienelactone hydrolase